MSGLTSLLDHPDIPVRVAINRDAIHVINPKKNVSLYMQFLDLPHSKVSTILRPKAVIKNNYKLIYNYILL